MKPLLCLALMTAAAVAEPTAPIPAAEAAVAEAAVTETLAPEELPSAPFDTLRAAAPERDPRMAPPAPVFTPDRGPARFVGLAGIVEVAIP